MTPIEHIRKITYPKVLKPAGFSKDGIVWKKEINEHIIWLISYDKSVIKSDDFLLSIDYGVYFNGVEELLHNSEYSIKREGLVSCIVKDSMDKDRKPNSYSFNPDSALEDLQEFVESNIKNKAIPFLQQFTTAESICQFIANQKEKFIKSDSIVLLKLSCIYYLTGAKKEAIETVSMVIEVSKKPYPFAENLLKKIKGNLD